MRWSGRQAARPSATPLRETHAGSAHARGCRTFLDNVQSQNAPMFERLHWRTLSQLQLHGRPHHFMQADLDYYPAITDGAQGIVVAAGRVAA